MCLRDVGRSEPRDGQQPQEEAAASWQHGARRLDSMEGTGLAPEEQDADRKAAGHDEEEEEEPGPQNDEEGPSSLGHISKPLRLMAALDERDSERAAAKAKATAKAMSSEGDEAAKEPRATAKAKARSGNEGGEAATEPRAKAKARSGNEGGKAAKEPRAKANAKSGSEKTGGQTASVLKRPASAQAPANPSSYSACHERTRSQIYVRKVGGGKGSCSLFKYGPGMKYNNEKSVRAAVEKFMAEARRFKT